MSRHNYERVGKGKKYSTQKERAMKIQIDEMQTVIDKLCRNLELQENFQYDWCNDPLVKKYRSEK